MTVTAEDWSSIRVTVLERVEFFRFTVVVTELLGTLQALEMDSSQQFYKDLSQSLTETLRPTSWRVLLTYCAIIKRFSFTKHIIFISWGKERSKLTVKLTLYEPCNMWVESFDLAAVCCSKDIQAKNIIPRSLGCTVLGKSLSLTKFSEWEETWLAPSSPSCLAWPRQPVPFNMYLNGVHLKVRVELSLSVLGTWQTAFIFYLCWGWALCEHKEAAKLPVQKHNYVLTKLMTVIS